MLEKDQREKMKLIINTGELLLNQVKGILDKNLLDQNMFTANLESNSLSHLLHSTVKMIGFHAHANNVKLKFNAPKADLIV